jgi:hypothetical protein
VQVLDALDSKDKIPYVNEIGGMFYNLWQDEKNKVPRTFYTAQRPCSMLLIGHACRISSIDGYLFCVASHA